MADIIINENKEEITKIQNKINRLKNNLVDKDKVTKKDKNNTPKSTQKQLGVLNAEYEKLRQLRLDQCSSLKSQWEGYQHEQKSTRRKDIEKRQGEFDKELKLADKEMRKNWKDKPLRKEKKKEICNQLINKLTVDLVTLENRVTGMTEEIESSQSITICHSNERDPIDTSVVIIPYHLLELFWSVDVDIPIIKSEIPSTIDALQKILSAI